jgi:hypothetical protein
LGQWDHIVGTIEGTVGRVYVNGEEALTYDVSDTFNAVESAGQLLRFGASLYGGGFSFLNGKMSACAIYDYALDPTRIAVHYDAR